MFFNKEFSIITNGDLIDLYLKIKNKGWKFIFSKFLKVSYKGKVSSKWNNYVTASDFWVIPEVRVHWNKIISGKETISYEEYVSKKFLNNKNDLSLLSVGCGEGIHERNFYNHTQFKRGLGIDISIESIKIAKTNAAKENKNISYLCSDFFKVDFKTDKFDVILFDSSLHHFEHINHFLENHIKPLLNTDGILVIFEYCGPNRLQWTKNQLMKCNNLLQQLPGELKQFDNSKYRKKKVYRPGILRMFAIDPSEAPDSINLIDALHSNFDVIEEKKLGWNIIQPLFKGIAHNFLNEKLETKEWISFILKEEEDFIRQKGDNTDAVFGIYK